MVGRLSLPIAMVVLAVAILLGSLAISDGIRDRGRSDVLTVTGSAKRRITSDYVVWTASLTSNQPTSAAASRELAG